MIWRAALVCLAVGILCPAAPASAQWYPQWGPYDERPFWGRPRRSFEPYEPYEPYQRYEPSDRHVPGRERSWADEPDYPDEPYYGDERSYGEGERNARPGEVRSGGARPLIYPRAPAKIAFRSGFAPKSIVIDTAGRRLYYILSPYQAYAYPISVGREGFSWTGTEVISRKQEWPDWYPPKEMIARDPRVPAKMTGGIANPLGAMALYLGKTLYRIHGTNDPNSLGRASSSGCFRMMNEHVLHLAMLAPVGTKVTVVRRLPPSVQPAAAPPPPPPYDRYLPQRY